MAEVGGCKEWKNPEQTPNYLDVARQGNINFNDECFLEIIQGVDEGELF